MLVQECIICGHQKAYVLCEKDEQKYLSCANCDHVFADKSNISPPQSPDTSVGTHHISKVKQEWDFSEFKKRKVFGPRLRKISSFINSKSLLDIGCSNGAFIQAAAEKGWNVSGIELRKVSAKVAQDRGLKVYSKPLEQLAFPSQLFSVITLWQVLEHLTDPEAVLVECHRILERGGILALSTPNIKSIGWLLLKKDWPAIDPFCHFHLFDASNLEKLLFRCGFMKCTVQTMDLQPATVKQVIRKIRNEKNIKSKNTAAGLISASSSFSMLTMFTILDIINYPLMLSGLGEDIYGYFKKI